MPLMHTVPPEEATGKLQELYDDDLKRLGYVANYSKGMSMRPEVITAWRQLIGAIRSSMRLRRYELVIFAVAPSM